MTEEIKDGHLRALAKEWLTGRITSDPSAGLSSCKSPPMMNIPIRTPSGDALFKQFGMQRRMKFSDLQVPFEEAPGIGDS